MRDPTPSKREEVILIGLLILGMLAFVAWY